MIELPLYSSNFLREQLQPSESIIDKVAWEGDLIMLLGSEKAGKSILAQQMAVAITSGSLFLNKYKVPKKRKIMYLQCEGKRSDYIKRMNNMRWALPCDDEYFFHIPKKFLPIDIDEYFNPLEAHIALHRPEVLFVDPLYMAMSGDLIDNKASRNFLAKISYLMDTYNLTVIMIHHDSKEQYDKEHKKVQRGDRGSYGSVFFRANVDHILYLNKQKDQSRTLTCDTQRSGDILTEETLILVQPRPLLFEIKTDWKPSERVVYYHLKECGMHGSERGDLIKLCSPMSESSVDKALKEMFLREVVKKSSDLIPKYSLRNYSLI